MRHWLAILGCVLALTAVSATASTVRFDGFSNGYYQVDVDPPSIVGATVDAGRYTGVLDGQSFYSFCVDLFHTLSFGTTYNDYARADATPYLQTQGFSAADASARSLALAQLATAHLGQLVDTLTTAAFQLAIWEIRYEPGTSFSLSGGGFTASGGANAASAVDLANSWLSALGGPANVSAEFMLNSDTHQDVVVFTPLPGALIFLASGLLGLLGMSRRARA